MKINEMFIGIQGEGRYAGYPVLFIRLSGCNRNCSFCDTKYHDRGTLYAAKEIIRKIHKCKCNIVVWTGGEPLKQIRLIEPIIKQTGEVKHHLESNGDLIWTCNEQLKLFDYIAFSPKDISAAKEAAAMRENEMYGQQLDRIDIKVVTNMRRNGILVRFATMLMPLTVENEELNARYRQEVWKYCVKNRLKYSPRLHYEVWGSKRRV